MSIKPQFDDLLTEVNNCKKCNRMCARKKVLSKESNGKLDSKVLFIAEAPGRLGAELTGIPLCGDKTGNNFEMLLSSIGWKREDVFITNSILCNPQDDNGNNSTPTQEEIQNCNDFLKKTLEIINPELVVTLGAKALDSIKHIENHNYFLHNSVATKLSWNNKFLFPLYHTSPLARRHRNKDQQKADFCALSQIVNPY